MSKLCRMLPCWRDLKIYDKVSSSKVVNYVQYTIWVFVTFTFPSKFDLAFGRRFIRFIHVYTTGYFDYFFRRRTSNLYHNWLSIRWPVTSSLNNRLVGYKATPICACNITGYGLIKSGLPQTMNQSRSSNILTFRCYVSYWLNGMPGNVWWYIL